MAFPFNVRVYGALVVQGHILLSDEHYRGLAFTKLPGGGLEYGEGLRDALRREFMEEAGIAVLVREHLYTTDFFQASAFNPDHQVISVYYRVQLETGETGGPIKEILNPLKDPTPDDLKPLEKDQMLRWVKLSLLDESHFTFPIEKQLVHVLRSLPST